MSFRCRLCQQTRGDCWQAKDAKSGEMLGIVLCAGCGLVQQQSIPESQQLADYYSHHYRQDYKSTYAPRLKHVYRAGAAALTRLAFMARAGIPLGLRLLDVGAGGGEFCYLAGKAGYQASGIEPNLGYSAFAREQYAVGIVTAGVESLGKEQADVITLFHVLEHLPDPGQAIGKLWEALRPGGFLVIEVPNLQQNDASPSNIYFKAHLFYFTRYSLLAAASRHFELLCMEDGGNLQIALRRRAEPLAEPLLPTPAQVEITRARLREKGWVEYLFAGRGLVKPLRRLERLWGEARLGRRAPRQLLDSLSLDDIQRRPHALRLALAGGVAIALDACT
jgi:2-polyprenyl-3-methyl-5-hydroxy-6-metoxy-1,4-benzoquinol methylase